MCNPISSNHGFDELKSKPACGQKLHTIRGTHYSGSEVEVGRRPKVAHYSGGHTIRDLKSKSAAGQKWHTIRGAHYSGCIYNLISSNLDFDELKSKSAAGQK